MTRVDGVGMKAKVKVGKSVMGEGVADMQLSNVRMPKMISKVNRPLLAELVVVVQLILISSFALQTLIKSIFLRVAWMCAKKESQLLRLSILIDVAVELVSRVLIVYYR